MVQSKHGHPSFCCAVKVVMLNESLGKEPNLLQDIFPSG